jgi:hypothetical protein
VPFAAWLIACGVWRQYRDLEDQRKSDARISFGRSIAYLFMVNVSRLAIANSRMSLLEQDFIKAFAAV